MDFQSLILPFGASMLIGALIGLEREKRKQTKHGMSAVGIRTSTLVALFGATAALLGKVVSPLLFYICLGSMIALTVASYVCLSIKENRFGQTTEISTILVFLLGAMSMMGYAQIAIAIAIVITLILSLRDYLHRAIRHLNQRELSDTIKFAIIAFIILPFLPNQSYDQEVFSFFFPLTKIPVNFFQVEILNPYRIWFLVVLVSGISFLGYILVKTIGKSKGISMAGLIGGIYSSTVTSLTLARKSKTYTNLQRPFVTGIVLACGISFLRTYIEIRTLNEELFYRTLIPVTMMFGYLMIIGLYLFFTKKEDDRHYVSDHAAQFKTPFELKEALKLGGFIVGSLILAKLLLSFSSVNLYYVIASIMAFFAIDDPIIISTAASAGKLISYDQAKNVILLVLYLNMVQKVAVIYFFGNRKLFKSMAFIFGGLLLVTLAGFIYF
jgi:uncharacterized membrane protein (DUF4010 family)